ncbi:MAG: Ig-like domain-containing protein [Sphingobacterium sp.]
MNKVSKNNKSSLNRIETSEMQKVVLFCFILLISVTLIRCANIQAPTGGPKDSLPPTLLNESPTNFKTNFTEREITLEFDEYIKLNNQFKEFSISPDLEEIVDYRVRKKRLVITLPDTLAENTTYTINFGKGLGDYNEGNPILNYNYVFATGPELDSLTISGKVTNGQTKSFDPKKDENIKVILIPISQDSIFGKKKASIFTNVDTSGNFKFQNLREDQYRIYALKEQNNDRIFNGREEWIGFLNDSLDLKDDISAIHLEITKAFPKDLRLLEKKIEPQGSILLTFNKPVEEPVTNILFPEGLNESKIEKLNPTSDSLRIYIADQELDSIKIEVASKQGIVDTSLIRVTKNIKWERDIKPQLNITNKVDRTRHITLTSTTPISSVDKSKIIITEDSVSRRNFQLEQDSVNQELYHIRYNWRPAKNYELVIQENAINGPFGDTNNEFKNSFTLDESDNYGNINFTLTGLDSTMNYIVELIDEGKEKVFDRRFITAENASVAYQNYPGGKYSIRVVYDENGNGKWDPADVYAKQQAENIWYLNKTFTIRANWDQNDTLAIPPVEEK